MPVATIRAVAVVAAWFLMLHGDCRGSSAVLAADIPHTNLCMDELREGLSSAGVADPDALSRALQALEMECARDRSALDGGERAEMMELLGAAGVPLGARSKLRRMIGSESHAVSWSPASSIQSSTQSSIENPGNGEEIPRQLQEESKASTDGVSMDTIAILITAALGLGSFFVQAQVAKAADITQREVERRRLCT
jgi:hypothetical protein